MKKIKTVKTSQVMTCGSGFTLIEVLVSLVVVSIVMIVMASAFVEALNFQRRATNIQQAQENAGFLLDAMTKKIRVSDIVPPVADVCTTSTLTINHPSIGTILYSLSGNEVHETINSVDSTVSSNTVEFTRLGFCISGAQNGDKKQSRVTIIGSVRSKETREQAEVNFQTTVSLRHFKD